MSSEWVKTEIANARQREIREKRQMLFPITLVPFEDIQKWKAFDADTGKDSAREVREYFIPDFSNWKDHDSYYKAFERLLSDLALVEKRFEHRFLCADIVLVSWISDGLQHEEHGNLEDISPSGCGLLMEQAVSESTDIEVRCEGHAFDGTVRYCRQTEIGFDIGIQFTKAGAWKREEFEPQHLFDVQSLKSERD
jgi:PilZ domain